MRELRGGAEAARHRDWWEYVVLVSLIVAVSVATVVWLRADTRFQPVNDPYPTFTLEYIAAVQEGGLAEAWRRLPELSLNGRSPLYQLLTVPLVLAFGRSLDVLISINIAFLALLLWSTYGMTREISNGRAGLLAAGITASYPPLIGLSKIHMPHFALAACVALSTWLLTRLVKTRSAKAAWLFGASVGLGVLVRHWFVMIIPLPALAVGLYMILFQKAPSWPERVRAAPGGLARKLRDPFLWRGLVPAALLAVLLAGSWYLVGGQEFLGTIERVSQVSGQRGIGFEGVAPSPWWYAVTAPGAISWVLALLFSVGLIGFVLRPQGPRLILVLIIVSSYAAVSTRTDLAWFNMGPVLPVAASITAAFLVPVSQSTPGGGPARLRRAVDSPNPIATKLRLPAIVDKAGPAMSALLVAICVVAALFVYGTVNWGMPPWGTGVARALGSPLGTETCDRRLALAFCPMPPAAEDWRAHDVIARVLEEPACRSGECRLAVLGEVPELFNYFSLRFELASAFPGSSLRLERLNTNLPIAPAAHWSEWLEADYLLSVQGYQEAPGLVQDIERLVADPPAGLDEAYAPLAAFTLPSGLQAQVIRRVRELSADEVLLVLEAVRLSRRSTATDAEATLSEYQEALEKDPGSVLVNVALGAAYRTLGERDAAIAYFESALALQPASPHLLTELGLLREARGDLDDAEAALEQACSIGGIYGVDACVHLGDLHYAQGQLEPAAGAYERAVAARPGDSRAHAGLIATEFSLLQMRSDSSSEASVLRTCERAAVQVPGDGAVVEAILEGLRTTDRENVSGALVNQLVSCFEQATGPMADGLTSFSTLGTTLERWGELDVALEVYEEMARRWPLEIKAYTDLARVHKQRGCSSCAISTYAECVDNATDTAWCHLELARLYRSEGDTNRAVLEYGAVTAQDGGADGYEATAALELAQLLEREGQYGDALESYRTAAELLPDNDQAVKGLVRTLLVEASNQETSGLMREAIALYQEALQWQPFNKTAHLELISAWKALAERSGRAADVAALNETALRALDGLAGDRDVKAAILSAYEALGPDVVDARLVDVAADMYEEDIAVEPEDRANYLRLGALYEAQERWDAALSTYERALSIWPKDELYYTRMAGIHKRNDDEALVVQVYQACVSELPESPWCHLELARLYRNAGDSERAIRAYESVIRLDADRSKYWLGAYLELGNLYERMGEWGAARDAYTSAAKEFPGDAEVHFALAALYDQQEMAAQAIVEYQAVLELDPSDDLREAAQSRLNELASEGQ